MRGTHYIFFFFFTATILTDARSWMTLERDVNDQRDAPLISCWDSHTTSSQGKCICMDEYDTMMSDEGEKWACKSPYEIDCKFSLMESKQTHLFTKRNETRKVHPSSISSDPAIFQITVWNVNIQNNIGSWLDITKELSRFFSFTASESKSKSVESVTTHNLNTNLLQGHVFKVTFGHKTSFYRPCFTFKVKGKTAYPFKLEKLKESVQIKTTQRTTTVYTTMPTTFSTTLGTETKPSTKDLPTSIGTIKTPSTTMPFSTTSASTTFQKPTTEHATKAATELPTNTPTFRSTVSKPSTKLATSSTTISKPVPPTTSAETTPRKQETETKSTKTTTPATTSTQRTTERTTTRTKPTEPVKQKTTTKIKTVLTTVFPTQKHKTTEAKLDTHKPSTTKATTTKTIPSEEPKTTVKEVTTEPRLTTTRATVNTPFVQEYTSTTRTKKVVTTTTGINPTNGKTITNTTTVITTIITNITET